MAKDYPLVLEDIGAEVIVNPNEVAVIKTKKKTRSLRKGERSDIVTMLNDSVVANCSDVVSAVRDNVSKQNHIYINKEREELWKSLMCDQPFMTIIVVELTKLFIHLYESCQKGKDKFCRLQFEWHGHCSEFLKDQVTQNCHSSVSQIHQKWIDYCVARGISKHGYNPVMIAFYSAVYENLMHKVRIINQPNESEYRESAEDMAEQEDD